MTDSSWPAAYKMVRQEEGGNDDDPQDHGGRTSRGITQREYNAWRSKHDLPAKDVWTASEQEIEEIYHTNYWPICDRLPAGVDVEVFDMNVLSGPRRSAITLQKALGNVAVDGVIGPDTLAKVDAADVPQLINSISNVRRQFYRGLEQPRFLQGWLNRVNYCKDVALQVYNKTSLPRMAKTIEFDEEDSGLGDAMIRLADASVPVRNAVYDAVHQYIRDQLAGWDSIWRDAVIGQVESENGRKFILGGCDAAIAAYIKAMAGNKENTDG